MTILEKAVQKIKKQQQPDLFDMRLLIAAKYPITLAALKAIEFERSGHKRRKGFSLEKRESKKHGFLYYARYSHNGKMLPTKWNTYTNDEAAAERDALENKERRIEKYLSRREARIYSLLERFYTKNNEANIYTRNISENRRKEFHGFIANYFLPFLKKEKITCFEQITKRVICGFQDSLLFSGVSPQSINNKMKGLKNIFAYAVRKGMADSEPEIKGVPVHREDRGIHDCHELDKLKGIFDEGWKKKKKEELYYILNLLVHATGMRNSEIQRLKQEE